MQIELKFFKVLGPPSEPLPNAVYFVEADDAVEIYITDENGVLKNAGSPALVQALMDASDALVYKGVIDPSGSPNYPAADAGHTYRFSLPGKIGGALGVNVTADDMMICVVDGSGAGDHSTTGANWDVIERNLDGAVIGPASAVHNRIAVFVQGTGKRIKDGGLTVADLAPVDSPNFSTMARLNGTPLITETDLAAYAVPLTMGIVTYDEGDPTDIPASGSHKLHVIVAGASAKLPDSGMVAGKTRLFIQFGHSTGEVLGNGFNIEYAHELDGGMIGSGGVAGSVNLARWAVGEFWFKGSDTWVLMGAFNII